jgi:two-component system phosphate regulon sensor histidine kinase PhoR
VEDTGPGIRDDERDRIFERFYRGRSSRESRVQGSGLGLSIAKHLVQAMEGEIHVESRRGKGSAFTINLPLFR